MAARLVCEGIAMFVRCLSARPLLWALLMLL